MTAALVRRCFLWTDSSGIIRGIGCGRVATSIVSFTVIIRSHLDVGERVVGLVKVDDSIYEIEPC